jgi:cellulose synthase/poly-beta-1,6-N-acetylglucosamine synthase-like glycosyltransferase
MYLSWKKINSFIHEESTCDWETLPPVSFLVPAYNEEALIVETLQTYLHLPHPQKEIIIIDDGSHDKTMNLLKVMFQLKKSSNNHLSFYQSLLHPCLKVVCAPHKGKAAALNFGLMHTQYELICTMDADTIPNARGVKACLIEFSKNKNLIAAGGVIQILPSDKIKAGKYKFVFGSFSIL